MLRRAGLALILSACAIPGSAQAADGACSGDGRAGGDWPMYGQNLEGNRHQTAEKTIGRANVGKLKPVWAVPYGTQSTPVASGSCVYVTDDDAGKLVALDLDTGAVVWDAALEEGGHGTRLTSGQSMAVSVTNGRVHVNQSLGDAGVALAFDANTGARLWKSERIEFGYPTGVITSATVHNGIQFISTFGPDGSPQARPGYAFIDAATGQTIYKQMTLPEEDVAAGYAGGGMWGTPVYDLANGYMFNGTANPYTQKREHPYDNAILKFDVDRARPTFGKIVAHHKGSPDGFVGSYEDNPACQSDLYPGAGIYDPVCVHLDLDIVSPTAFRNSKGELLVGAIQRDGRFHVADAATMAEEWSATLSHPDVIGGESTAAADDDTVYVATNRGPVFALDVDDGAIKWVTWVPSVLSYSPLSLANGVLYVPGNQTGTLTALDSSTGERLWTTSLVADAIGGGAEAECVHVGAGVSIARGYVIAACDSRNTIAYKLSPSTKRSKVKKKAKRRGRRR